MKLKQFFAFAVPTIVLPLFFTGTSHAIPAFSRALKVECTTCHTIFPELNEYGEAFLKNSYVYVGKGKKGAKEKVFTPTAAPPPSASSTAGRSTPEIKGDGDAVKLSKLKSGAMSSAEAGASDAPVAAAPAATSATAGASQNAGGEEKSEGLLLAAIPEQLPISFTGSVNVVYDNKAVNELDFATRYLKLHAGGNFRDMVGFYGTYVAYSEQAPVGNYNSSINPSNNKTDINEFFLSWRHALNTPVNLRIGRMQPKLGLWKTNNKLSVTNNYFPYTYTVGKESAFRVEQNQDAIELNSVLANRLFVAGGVVNRKGQTAKEGYIHASYKLGGADYLANEPEIDLAKDEHLFDFLTVSMGSYAYFGKNGTANSNDPKNNFYRAGLDTELYYKAYRFRMLGGIGEDDNVAPSLVTQQTRVISKSATFEAEYALRQNLLAAARFEYLQQEGPQLSSSFSNIYARRYAATVGYNPYENLKLVVEYKYETVASIINRLGTLGLTFGF
ncbi:MAG: hypothetical protein WCP10_08830 [Desulfuromonadales bacterium]